MSDIDVKASDFIRIEQPGGAVGMPGWMWVQAQRLADSRADEIERLRSALAASCDENRSVALAEPGRTATCPLERELRAENERLRAALETALVMLDMTEEELINTMAGGGG